MITGWITNKGKVIVCGTYEHFNVEDETLVNIWKPYEEQIGSAYQACEDLANEGEHPEWHNYEMCQDDCQRRAYDDAYKLGYLRLTSLNPRGELPRIAVEGLPQWIESHKIIIKELADKYECGIKTFPVKINKY